MARVIPARRRWGPVGILLVVILSVAGLLVWAAQRQPDRSAIGPSPAGTSPQPPVDPRYDDARMRLTALPVKDWDRAQDYERYRFGERWSDDVDVEFGHNGCNTRDDILRRDLADLVVRDGTCYAQSGILRDPYTGQTIDFVRGPDTSGAVEIDHVVSLADAWYKGARSWDDQRRLDFANDPRNLLAVAPEANFDKAFRDAAGWLPPNAGYRCDFVARQIDVKTVYGLWVSGHEKTAMADVLRQC